MPMSEATLRRLVRMIHEQRELNGVMIGFYGDFQCRLADPGTMVTLNYQQRVVIIEIVEEPASGPISARPVESVAHTPTVVTNGSRIGRELIGAGISCGFTVISALGVAGSAAAEVPSAGTSTFALVVAWAGLVTSSIQCINGIVRTAEAVTNPGGTSLAQWDQNQIYSYSILIVDAVGVGSGLAALPQATRNLLAVLERRGGMVSAQALASMGREQRAAAIQQALAEASRNPESRAVLEQAIRDAGISARELRRVATSPIVAARNSRVIGNAITQETSRRLQRAMVDVIAGVGQSAASGLPEELVGSASGSVNRFGGVILHALQVG